VFLPTLEYYQEMGFLTTNRVKQIDDAIASRIYFKTNYPELGFEQSKTIFLERADYTPGSPIYSSKTFDDLVRKVRNGREVDFPRHDHEVY